MPKTKRQNDQIKAERHAAIIKAAVPLFVRNGFDKTKVSEIARAAGVSHGTVFLYFATKEELFRTAIMEPLEDADFTYLRHVQGTPLERLQHMIRDHLTTFLGLESYLRLVHYVLGQPERFPDLTAAISAFSRRFCTAVAELIVEGQQKGELGPGNAELTAGVYFASLNGIGMVMTGPPMDKEPLIQPLMRLFNPITEPGGQ